MMEKFNGIVYFIILLIFGWLLSACQPNTKNIENSAMNQRPYILHFGQQGFKDFAQYNLGRTDSHPSGADFRELDFTPPNLGQIKVENSTNSLVIDHVFSVLGTSFSKDDGIQKLSINAGLNKEEFVSPKQAYQGYVELMKRLNQAGWKNYVVRYDPRIAKEDNIRYLMEGHDVIDLSYIFNDEEWEKIINSLTTNSIGYRLYANGIILGISLNRTEKNKDGREQYMVRYAFQTARYNQRNLISDSSEMTVQELEQKFKSNLERYKRLRETEEKDAIAQGYRIDESYVDPDVWQYAK